MKFYLHEFMHILLLLLKYHLRIHFLDRLGSETDINSPAIYLQRSGPALKDCNSTQSAYAHGAQEHDVLLREENPEAEQVYSDMKAARNSQEVFNPTPLQKQMTMMSPSEYLIAHFHEKRVTIFLLTIFIL